MSQEVEEIKQRIDIVDVVGEYVSLMPAGSNYKARSPFRSERTPSFMVSHELQIFKDFGGDKSGDVFTFLMEMEGISFREALTILAERAGVSLSQNPQAQAQASQKDTLTEILGRAVTFYQQIGNHPTHGENAREYLEKRGVNQDTRESFQLGYAPQSFQTLTKAFLQKGYTQEQLQQAGLINVSASGRPYDRFRGRVMIPIKSSLGRPLGFTARILPEYDDGQMGKYINSPQTEIFDKSMVLFGLDQAKTAIKSQKRVIVVEGQLDVLLSHQAGVKEVVAISGTALTDDHIRTLKRYTSHFCLAFDPDQAGMKACKRSATRIWQMGGRVSVIPLPQDMDVADLVTENPEVWYNTSWKVKDFIRYWIECFYRGTQTLEDKQQAASEVSELLTFITEPIQRNTYIQDIAPLLGLTEQEIYDMVSKKTSPKHHDTSNLSHKSDPLFHTQRRLLGYLLISTGQRNLDSVQELFPDQLRSVIPFVLSPSVTHPRHLKDQFSEEQFQLVQDLYLEIYQEVEDNQLTDHDIDRIIQEHISFLHQKHQRNQLQQLRRQLAQAKYDQDSDRVEEILHQIQTLTT